MALQEKPENNLALLERQLHIARDEINNLRKEVKCLKYSHSKEISKVRAALESWRCPSCHTSSSTPNNLEKLSPETENGHSYSNDEGRIELQPIGFISTGFVRKRAVPRQPNVNLSSQGKVSIHNFVFSNPEHSLDGLDGFSHMWILFYFHKNMSNHIRAKVAPPRLNGARVGVFGTRSPHRPCPIGLSLVQIEKIEGSCVYFSGVDMLDGTPVLDLKPYIPHYDNPAELSVDYPENGMVETERRELDGQESDEGERASTSVSVTLLRPVEDTRLTEREAPDGEEGNLEGTSLAVSPSNRAISPLPHHRHVRVPEWISRSTSRLQVTFSPQAENQVEENMKRVIADILREDPRSVYLRDRYANQFYTFLINDFHVSCKFDDNNGSVKVFRVVPASTECECGTPEWQCSVHGNTAEA